MKYDLVMRKWVEINPVNEFRCFVKNKNLIGKKGGFIDLQHVRNFIKSCF